MIQGKLITCMNGAQAHENLMEILNTWFKISARKKNLVFGISWKKIKTVTKCIISNKRWKLGWGHNFEQKPVRLVEVPEPPHPVLLRFEPEFKSQISSRCGGSATSANLTFWKVCSNFINAPISSSWGSWGWNWNCIF